jgi:hypothetical protein
MSIAIVASLSAQANLLALLQAKADAANLGVKFTADSFTFGTPSPATATDDKGNTYNTSVVVEAKPGSGFTGSSTLYYNRLKLAETVLAPQSSYTLQDSDDDAAVIAMVEKALGLAPGHVSLIGEVARPQDGSSLTLAVTASTFSPLYTDDTFQITLTWQRDLNTLFTDPYLDGFVTAEEPESTGSTGEITSTAEVASS